MRSPGINGEGELRRFSCILLGWTQTPHMNPPSLGETDVVKSSSVEHPAYAETGVGLPLPFIFFRWGHFDYVSYYVDYFVLFPMFFCWLSFLV